MAELAWAVAGIVVILATVAVTVLITVPLTCKRCGGKEGNDDASV